MTDEVMDMITDMLCISDDKLMELSKDIADTTIDALVGCGIIKKEDIDRACEIAEEEARVRLIFSLPRKMTDAEICDAAEWIGIAEVSRQYNSEEYKEKMRQQKEEKG